MLGVPKGVLSCLSVKFRLITVLASMGLITNHDDILALTQYRMTGFLRQQREFLNRSEYNSTGLLSCQ